MNTRYSLFFFIICLGLIQVGYSQTVLYENDFDGMEDGTIPEGWTHVAGIMHEEASEDATCGWTVIPSWRFVAFDFGGGDQVRDQMGYYRLLDANSNPNLDIPCGSPESILNPPPTGTANWRRQGGDRSPWKNPPFMTLGQLSDGTYPNTAGILVGDSDQYGGANLNLAVDSAAIPLNGSKWVRLECDQFYYANQDQSAGSWYRLDEGAWKPLFIADNYSHGDDQGYAGFVSYAIETGNASTIQFRWWLASNFGWLLVVDNLKVVGFSSIPIDGPAKPTLLSPSGIVKLSEVTQLKASPYSDSTGGTHVFSEWEIRTEDGTYGDMIQLDADGNEIDSPVLRTSIQPNEFAVNAVEPDDANGNDKSGRSDAAPFDPISFGREQAGAQVQIDLKGDQTVLNIPSDMLRPDTTYYAHVRYWNNKGYASPWSDELSFTIQPVSNELVLEENFDMIGDALVYDRLVQEGWQADWLDINLNILQVVGDDLTNFGTTEPDGRGLNGHFSSGVLHSEGAYSGLVHTPAIDNSNGAVLTVIFDSSWRYDCVGSFNVIIGGTSTTLLAIGDTYIKKNSDLSIDGTIYQNSYVFTIPETAGQSSVQFEWEFVSGYWWTIDNVLVGRGEYVPVKVNDWQLF